MMKKTILTIALVASALPCLAENFVLHDRTETRKFTQTGVLGDGIKIFNVVTSTKNLPSKSTDKYVVDCKNKQVIVHWGPTTGGTTGIDLPGGGSANLTNKSDMQPILDLAC